MYLKNIAVETLGYVRKTFSYMKWCTGESYIAMLLTLQRELSPATDIEFYSRYFNNLSEAIIHPICFLDGMDNIQCPIESDI